MGSAGSRRSAVIAPPGEPADAKDGLSTRLQHQSPQKVADSTVQMAELVKSAHCNQRGVATVGTVLRWLDVCACLSAERHSGRPCVTLGMDEMVFEESIMLGSIVLLHGCVTNVFNTSMEVKVQVDVQDGQSGRVEPVATCYFVFVSMGPDGRKSKQRVPQILAQTQEEVAELVLSKERRRLRLNKASILRQLLSEVQNPSVDHRDGLDTSEQAPLEVHTFHSSEFSTSTTHLVLPMHANHHGNTFGGQIMEWMDQTAVITSLKYAARVSEAKRCRLHVNTVGLDSVTFVGPSRLGDRIVIKAGINRVFRWCMEVGVYVDAVEVGKKPRHINTGFFTVALLQEIATLDSNGVREQDVKTIALPPVIPDSTQRYNDALGRQRFRDHKRRMIKRCSHFPTKVMSKL